MKLKSIIKYLYIALFELVTLACANGQDLKFNWALNPQDSAIYGGEIIGRSNVVDESGNVYIVGSFEGVCDFDPSICKYPLT